MKIVELKVSDLIEAEYNPRKISTKQLNELRDSVVKFGQVEPIIVNQHPDRMNIIIGGHQRATAFDMAGKETIFATVVKLPLELERELNIRLNQSGGEFDQEVLATFFDAQELHEWGFEDLELGIETDFSQEPEEQTKAILTFNSSDDMDLAKADIDQMLKRYDMKVSYK